MERGQRITGTFLDEISHDIPHQNWGEREWDEDFRLMKAIGIDTVVMIRCGYGRFITYPSAYLIGRRGCHEPSVDLVDLFLRLAERHGMSFWFGLYDPGEGGHSAYAEANRAVIDEVWARYGARAAFRGWYASNEFGRREPGSVEAVRTMGLRCKAASGGLPVFISPWIDGSKALNAFRAETSREGAVTVTEHEREWDGILAELEGAIDACAFQDGHIGYHELDAFFAANKRLCDRHGIECWTNAESFDRDMPIKFLPIKFEKLRLKLEAAARAGLDRAITFEFSHFMSPQSMYPSAGRLYDRYREYMGIRPAGPRMAGAGRPPPGARGALAGAN